MTRDLTRRRRDLPDWTNLLAVLPLAWALLVLGLGWGLGYEGLVRLRADLPAMVPETALALVFAGIGTLATINRWPPAVAALATLALAAVVGAYFIEPVMRRGLAAGERIVPAPGDGMAMATGFCLLCLGIAIVALAVPVRGARAVAITASALCALVSGTALMAHGLSSASVRDVLGFKEMSLSTAAGVFLLNLSLVLSHRDSPHFRGLFGPRRQSVILRASLILSILGVLVIGELTRFMTLRDWITPDFRLVFLCSAMIALLVASALIVGFLIDRLEAEKKRITALESASDRALQNIEINNARDENLRILGQIVAGVAHDFNNALTALRGNLELMEIDPSKSGTYLREAISAADRAAGLTNQLLDSGRQTRLHKGDGDVVTIAEQVVELFKRVAPINIGVTLTAQPATLGRVGIDDSTLERALLNLLVNARDAMPSGGDLHVTISQRVITNGFAATFNFNAGLTPGEHVVIEVTDTGSGMDEATVRRAVQPYFTTKEVGKGSGLGLASVNGVCQQIGGGLLINSAPGAGTTVVVALPVAPAEDDQATPAGEGSAPVDILLVANSAWRHRDVLGYLDGQDRHVRRVGTEQEALEFLDITRLPSVVLIDEGQFGGIDGEQIRADIENRFPDLPVVYVGDYGESRFDRAAPSDKGDRTLACA
ncbi:sensor histidine kinase [Marinovum algicola]|uniref:sensor histidine kinase n=1 Tax=Marinovum algicola TaxID=42444 RepID=UPI0024BB413F|nr:ATP-binding protein [Marinovum algicola]